MTFGLRNIVYCTLIVVTATVFIIITAYLDDVATTIKTPMNYYASSWVENATISSTDSTEILAVRDKQQMNVVGTNQTVPTLLRGEHEPKYSAVNEAKTLNTSKVWSKGKENQSESVAATTEVISQARQNTPEKDANVGNLDTTGKDVNVSNFTTNSTSQSTTLPQWMFEYFSWHKKQLAELNEENWRGKRIMVCRCLMIDKPCGGTSDRLQSLPFMIRLAHKMNRILFYKWTRPCNLEEFLLPAGGSINWTLPHWLHDRINYRNTIVLKKTTTQNFYITRSGTNLVTFIFQNIDYGKGWYEQKADSNESSWDKVYSELWHRTFTPSPGVADMIEATYRRLNMTRDNYVAVQVRSHWRTSPGPNNTALMRRAINSATHLPSSDSPMRQIYFAADNHLATKHALEYGRGYRRADVVAQSGSAILQGNVSRNPMHLDFNQSTRPSDYYDTFVDLYLLANGRCVAFGKGGFGKWSRLINRNGCYLNYWGTDKLEWNTAMPLLPEGVL